MKYYYFFPTPAQLCPSLKGRRGRASELPGIQETGKAAHFFINYWLTLFIIIFLYYF
jgi:hypothetical protein